MTEFSIKEIEILGSRFGLPLYVFDVGGFISNYRALESAMRSQYPNYHLSYSYKTNYTPYICKIVKSLGGYAEVVSGMEYFIAKKLGYSDSNVIFNGPNKGNDGTQAFLSGVIVNADNITEFKDYITAAHEYPDKRFKLGLRVNLDVGQNFISRFGLDESDIADAFELVSKSTNVSICGLQCHISRCRGLNAWKKRTGIILALADRFFSDSPEYLDLGSGMYGSMDAEFAAQFTDVPTYSEYASVTAKLVSEHYRGKKMPVLFTEPGTTVINRFVSLIGRVDAIKKINGKYFAVLNCSEHNLGETCTLKRLPVRIVHSCGETTDYSDIDLAGYTCLEQDVMYEHYSGSLAVGDYVVFGNVGGYSNVYKPPFIRPNCAMVAVNADGQYELMKEKENYTDILHTYQF